MAEIRLAAAFFVGIMLETLLYGVFLMLFGFNAYLQYEKSKQPETAVRLNNTMFFASCCFLVFVSVHWGLNFSRLYDACLNTKGGLLIDLYFANLREPMSITKTVFFELEIWVGDLILLYRLWHVYQRSLVICILPTLIWISLWVCGSALVWEMAHANAGGVFQHQIKQWITACFTLTLINNLYCTGLISWRLWSSHRAITRGTSSSLFKAMRVFMESAYFWTLFVLLTFVTFLAGSNIQYSFIDMTSPAVGISFCMLVARLNLESRSQTIKGSTFSAPGGSSQVGNSNIVYAMNSPYGSDKPDSTIDMRPSFMNMQPSPVSEGA